MTQDTEIKNLRQMEGLARRTTLTIEEIVKKIQPVVYGVVESVSADPEYISENYQPLD